MICCDWTKTYYSTVNKLLQFQLALVLLLQQQLLLLPRQPLPLCVATSSSSGTSRSSGNGSSSRSTCNASNNSPPCRCPPAQVDAPLLCSRRTSISIHLPTSSSNS